MTNMCHIESLLFSSTQLGYLHIHQAYASRTFFLILPCVLNRISSDVLLLLGFMQLSTFAAFQLPLELVAKKEAILLSIHLISTRKVEMQISLTYMRR